MYNYFDSKGPTKIPSRSEVERLATEHGVLTALVADANVCLDLAALTRGTLQPRMRAQVQAFVSDIAASGVDVLPGFGLAELSLDRATWKLDATKLESVERNITLAIDSAPGRTAQRDTSEDTQDGPVDVDMFMPHTPLLQIFYASLLRVAIISATGLDRVNALKNLQTFLEWMADGLNCVSALPLQAAVAIFGGDSRARRVIGIGKRFPALSDVWGGAWDLFYIYQLFYATLHNVDGVPHYPVFVTRDRACYEVFSRSRLSGAIRFDENRSPFLIGIATDYPHYLNTQEEVTRLFQATMLPRIEKVIDAKRMTQTHLDNTIVALECEWRGFYPEGIA